MMRTAEEHRTDADTIVEVRGLRMRYGSRDVLDGVDFTVERGEVVALLGPNGAGKTTTIEVLEGFRIRSAGEVRVLGVDPAEADEDWRARIGLVLQSWRDHARWTPRRLLGHLSEFYVPYSTPDRTRPYDLDELLDAVGLQSPADRKIVTLSARRCRAGPVVAHLADADHAVGLGDRGNAAGALRPAPDGSPSVRGRRRGRSRHRHTMDPMTAPGRRRGLDDR